MDLTGDRDNGEPRDKTSWRSPVRNRILAVQARWRRSDPEALHDILD